MKLGKLIRRFLIPSTIVSGIYWLKFRCLISPRAEVDFSPLLKVGRGTRISSFCKIKAVDGPVQIGRHVSIGANCSIGGSPGGVIIGDYCLLGPGVMVMTNNYRYDRLDLPIYKQGTTSTGVVIGDDVWIGANSTVLDGVRIGKGCVVGAGAIVRENLPDYTVAISHQRLVMLPRQSTEGIA